MCLSSSRWSLGEGRDLLHGQSRRFCRCEVELVFRRARCKRNCPRTRHAAVRTNLRVVAARRAMRRSSEGWRGLPREPRLVDRSTVGTTIPWRALTIEVRLGVGITHFPMKLTNAVGTSFDGWHQERVRQPMKSPMHVKNVLKVTFPDEEVTLQRSLQWTER